VPPQVLLTELRAPSRTITIIMEERHPTPEEIQRFLKYSWHNCPTGDRCTQEPCRDLIPDDPDFRADVALKHHDPVFHRNLWDFFSRPEDFQSVSKDTIAEYEVLLPRCQRIMSKTDLYLVEVDTQLYEELKKDGFSEAELSRLGL
jgi:hypothetical protein